MLTFNPSGTSSPEQQPQPRPSSVEHYLSRPMSTFIAPVAPMRSSGTRNGQLAPIAQQQPSRSQEAVKAMACTSGIQPESLSPIFRQDNPTESGSSTWGTTSSAETANNRLVRRCKESEPGKRLVLCFLINRFSLPSELESRQELGKGDAGLETSTTSENQAKEGGKFHGDTDRMDPPQRICRTAKLASSITRSR